MISPAVIRVKAERWWADQSFLRAWLKGEQESFFPKAITQIGLENESELVVNYGRILAEQELLRAGSKPVVGYGYTLDWQTKQKRSLGQVRLISRIQFETTDDFLRFIEKEQAFAQFVTLADQTRREVPELEPWLINYPLRLLNNARDWPHWLTICRFFRDRYEPDQYYIRQLPVPVHTKFLEERTGLLLNLLAVIRPALIRPGQKDWRKQLGLRIPEPMIRTRALDDALWLDGQHDDFGLPLSAFARHIQSARPGGAFRIVICENLLNFLTFPQMPNSVAIWSGGGFNIACLADVTWLREKRILYWGDLDAHGFQALNQCKGYFPNTQAILMDQATFDAHQHLAGSGESTLVSDLPNLSDDERDLFNLLKQKNWRVEQEMLGEEWVQSVLSRLGDLR